MALAAASAVVFRARPVFWQTRIGYRGRPIRVPKIRSLPVDTPPAVDKYRLRDVRVPAFGRVIRRTHLDELPQLLLVPFGRLSLVGK